MQLVACNVENDSDLSSRNEGGRPPPNLPLVRGRDFRRYRFQCYSPLDASERDLVVAGIKSFDVQRYQIAAYVVMDDHVHVLLRPFAGYELKAILHSWKSFTARQMQREHKRFGRVWQDESFDRIVRDDAEFAQKLDYIVGNPCKRWPEIEDYWAVTLKSVSLEIPPPDQGEVRWGSSGLVSIRQSTIVFNVTDH